MICEASELLIEGAGWVDVGQANGLSAAVMNGDDLYQFSPVRIVKKPRRQIVRFSRYNFDLCACGELPLISRARAEAGESRVLAVRGDRIESTIASSGRSAHNILRVVQPRKPSTISLNRIACWVFGLGCEFGVTTIHCTAARAGLLFKLANPADIEHQSRRYTDDRVIFYRPRLDWWRLSYRHRQTVYRLALLLHGRPGFYGARIEGCSVDDFDTLQWCATASGAHARLDVHGTCWLTQDRGNPAMYKGLSVDRRSGTAFCVKGEGETVITRYRGEIAAQYLSMG